MEGMGLDPAKEYLKLKFLVEDMQETADQMFSLSSAPMSLVCAFQRFLVEFILSWDIPCSFPLLDFVDDVGSYLYACLVNKKCCICGTSSDLHHLDHVGAGRDREEIIHEGMEVIPLCRVHHTEAHTIGKNTFESFIGKDIMEEPLEQYDKLLSPAVHFDFKNVTFTFLPHQVKDMDVLIKNLESSSPEIIGVAAYEQCKGFVEALARYQKFSDIRNVGAAIHSMIEAVQEKMDDAGFNEEEDWTYLTKLFGSNAIPASSAEVITKAIKKAEKEGQVTSKDRWRMIEILATSYLEGK